jgi:membrane-associated phospholipid phosphatase
MSAVEDAGRAANAFVSIWRRLDASARPALARLGRAPRGRIPWPSYGRIALGAAGAIVAVWLTMVALDAPLLAMLQRLPARMIGAFNDFTDLGRSGWFLWPTAAMLLALMLLDSPAMTRFSRAVLAAWAVRIGFVFAAIAAPGLFVTIVKRLIGRSRPLIHGNDGWTYLPFGWQVEYASFPSGHATTAFSALVAIGAIFPATRALMWTYAVMIAVSRVVVAAHHPSDVLAGAMVGALGALLVRNWFADRRLGFSVSPDGTVRPMPGPSWRRIVKAVARRSRTA